MKTPDPIRTTEQIPALAGVAIPAAVVLFKLDLSQAQQAAAVTLLGIAYAGFVFLHAAWLRGKRTSIEAAKAARPVVQREPVAPLVVGGSGGGGAVTYVATGGGGGTPAKTGSGGSDAKPAAPKRTRPSRAKPKPT